MALDPNDREELESLLKEMGNFSASYRNVEKKFKGLTVKEYKFFIMGVLFGTYAALYEDFHQAKLNKREISEVLRIVERRMNDAVKGIREKRTRKRG